MHHTFRAGHSTYMFLPSFLKGTLLVKQRIYSLLVVPFEKGFIDFTGMISLKREAKIFSLECCLLGVSKHLVYHTVKQFLIR